MTEDEAKTKLCFRAATFGASQQLVDGPGPLCVGSGCMAWRTITRVELCHSDGSIVQRGDSYIPSQVRQVPVVEGGFCGLAGRPA